MEPLLYSTLIMTGLILLTIIPLRAKFNKSQYQHVSGHNFTKTIFDKGNYGEFLTFCIFEKMGVNNILTNIYLPQKDGTTTEIDLLVVDTTGIYVFESKNYSGWIFGDEKNTMWSQSLKGGKKNRFFNPIWQNKGHISALDDYLDKEYTGTFFSYIIFSERCELKKISCVTSTVSVIKRNRLAQEFKNLLCDRPNRLSTEQVQKIYSKLKLRTLVDEDTKRIHIKEIKVKHK